MKPRDPDIILIEIEYIMNSNADLREAVLAVAQAILTDPQREAVDRVRLSDPDDRQPDDFAEAWRTVKRSLDNAGFKAPEIRYDVVNDIARAVLRPAELHAAVHYYENPDHDEDPTAW